MTIMIEAVLQPDGMTLLLEKKLNLAPDRVTLTVQSNVQTAGLSMLEMLERIHRDQKLEGRRPMTEEEMASEIAEMRSEDDFN